MTSIGPGFSRTFARPDDAQEPATSVTGRHAPLDQLLDLYIRDGLVYYRAMQSDRAKLDRYIASLNTTPETVAGWEKNEQAAFWLNAYNAIVLRTVIDRYPIQGTASAYPRNSIRQIPGAFDRVTWRVAGKAVTLDAIERVELAGFKDPRMFFAIGRGAVGGGRMRSEAFDGGQLEAQLAAVVDDCVRRVSCAAIDQTAETLTVSPIFSWREAEFVSTYSSGAGERYPGRSPVELAVLVFIEPVLFGSERDWLSRNRFTMKYATFDWRLNDLTGGGPK